MTNSDCAGTFTLVLHSHLPYVISHGRWPHGMDWLNDEQTTVFNQVPVIPAFANFKIFENKILYRGMVEKTIDAVVAGHLALDMIPSFPHHAGVEMANLRSLKDS